MVAKIFAIKNSSWYTYYDITRTNIIVHISSAVLLVYLRDVSINVGLKEIKWRDWSE